MSSILITGGAGFFGQAMIRRLLDGHEYDRICVYSRDEAKHAEFRSRLNDNPRLRWMVGCVRDKDRLERALRGVDVVVHAAALKRIEVGHYNPDEMVKTNVIGTLNVTDACAEAGVRSAVMLSTDKAFQPVSAYGQSKALAESLFISANHVYGQTGPKYHVVRYGNVAGSTGSVIPKWIAMGDEVDVTSLDCTRFWMLAAHAVDMVMHAISLPAAGDQPLIPILPAYRVGDLVEAMGKNPHVIGLPAWEKMHESMGYGNSSDTAHRMSVNELREALNYV